MDPTASRIARKLRRLGLDVAELQPSLAALEARLDRLIQGRTQESPRNVGGTTINPQGSNAPGIYVREPGSPGPVRR